MSYILEALKKAEQERSRGEVPDLSAAHAMAVPHREGRRLGIWLIAGLMLINLAALYLYQRDDGAEPRPQPSAAAEPAPVAAVAAPAAIPPVAVVPDPVPVPPPAEETLIVLPPPVARAAPVPQVTTAAPEPIAEQQLLSIPPWQQSSAAVQQLAAGLSLDVHVYADRPAQRFVLINMSKYREGDELREGALLERITAQGVVLSYRGERFRYDKP